MIKGYLQGGSEYVFVTCGFAGIQNRNYSLLVWGSVLLRPGSDVYAWLFLPNENAGPQRKL